jgi:hypothetical protein
MGEIFQYQIMKIKTNEFEDMLTIHVLTHSFTVVKVTSKWLSKILRLIFGRVETFTKITKSI